MSNPMYVQVEVSADQVCNNHDAWLGEACFIDERDLEQAHLILSRVVGKPEPVLYEDESKFSNYDKEEGLAEFIELQERLKRGLNMINKVKEENRVSPVISKKEYDSTLSIYWDHYHSLKARADELLKQNRTLYPQYKKLQQEDMTEYFTYGGDGDEYDAQAHKKDSPDIDNRMLASDEAYALAHIELNNV